MRDTSPDDQLLAAFAATHDEAAFRQIARRYSGLIYHTALRTLSDPALAEDASQRVLLALAKKAAQVHRSGTTLPAWLHRATVLEAKALRRSEARHARKKEALMHAPTPHQTHDAHSPWRDALPHLDAAIDTLPAAEREVLLLHFVNGLTFPEIARRLGRTAAAVQKQSRRSLEKLQRLLGKNGIALSIGILTAGLSTEMAKAAPAFAIPALGSALSKPSTALLAANKTTLVALAATTVLCAVPLAKQHATISKLEAQLAHTLPLTELSPLTRRTSSPRISSLSFLERLARDLNSQNTDVARYLDALDYLADLSNEELAEIIGKTINCNLSAEIKEPVLNFCTSELIKRDPQIAMSKLWQQIPEAQRGLPYINNLFEWALRDWSEKNPDAAQGWFDSHLDVIKRIHIQTTMPHKQWVPDIFAYDMREALAYGFFANRPQEAVEILRPIPADRLKTVLVQFVLSREPTVRKNPQTYITVVRALLPEKDAIRTIGSLNNLHLAISDESAPFANTEAVINQLNLADAEVIGLMREAGCNRFENAASAGEGELQKHIASYESWLIEMGVESEQQLIGEALERVVASWSDRQEKVCSAFEDQRTGLSSEAVVGFFRALENESFLNIRESTIQRIAACAQDSEEAQEIAARILRRYHPEMQ